MKYRWICYIRQNTPGNLAFDLTRYPSIRDAIEGMKKYSSDVLSDDCSATLYAYSAGDWTIAQQFEDVGCPFDYPDRIIERGPRGGWRVQKM